MDWPKRMWSQMRQSRGIGMTVIAAADKADAVLRLIRGKGHKAWVIGEVVKGNGATRLVGCRRLEDVE